MSELDTALEAARIAARATVEGAWVQFWGTVAAGGLAVFAGVLAYLAARQQLDWLIDEKFARRRAYASFVRAEIEALHATLLAAGYIGLVEGENGLRIPNATEKAQSSAALLGSPALSMPAFLAEDHWEHHALLGREAILHIAAIRADFRRLIAIQQRHGVHVVEGTDRLLQRETWKLCKTIHDSTGKLTKALLMNGAYDGLDWVREGWIAQARRWGQRYVSLAVTALRRRKPQ